MLSYKEFVAKYPKLLSLDKQGILKITTITSMYHFNITFNIPFVVDNLPLDPNFIINIKYGDNKTLTDQGKIYYRVIDGINNVPKKKNNTINKKKYIKHKNVDKQIRLEFKIKEEKINFKFKVFENGTIQATIIRTCLLFVLSFCHVGMWALIWATAINIIYVTIHQYICIKKALN